jgi:hypothetical protein
MSARCTNTEAALLAVYDGHEAIDHADAERQIVAERRLPDA